VEVGVTLPRVRKATGNPALYQLLGRKIANARSRHSDGPLSQSALAKKVGLTRGSIANIELGAQRPPLHIFWAISKALKIEPASLLPNSAELDGKARTMPNDSKLEPDVERVVEGVPHVRAWLTAARSRVGDESEDGRNRGRRP
jgi:transcriptional regulator with XRE-family HTH domain